jgi:hypothetical protein
MIGRHSAGKGDTYRPTNLKNYEKGWNRAFNKSFFRKIINKIKYWLEQPMERK